MFKLIYITTAFVVMVGSIVPHSVFAQSTAPAVTVTPSVEELTVQLQELTALYERLVTQAKGMSSPTPGIKSGLKFGMTDDDIKKVQALLATDVTIYPGGFVTGYYGTLTQDALKRFQAKNNLTVNGELDTMTRVAIDALLVREKNTSLIAGTPQPLVLGSSISLPAPISSAADVMAEIDLVTKLLSYVEGEAKALTHTSGTGKLVKQNALSQLGLAKDKLKQVQNTTTSDYYEVYVMVTDARALIDEVQVSLMELPLILEDEQR